MTDEPSAHRDSRRAIARRRFAAIGAAVLVVGALSFLALQDYDLLGRAEDRSPDAGNQPTLALANPASASCAEKGGTSEIHNTAQGQTGYCRFSDGRVCEEWTLFREGQCAAPQAER